MFVETNIRHVIWIHTINFFLHLAEYNSPIPSSNGNKKLTNVSQLFLNLSPHSLIYSSANMRQLLPTAVASLGNRIIELITCARWINGSVHGTSSARQRSRISFERFITSTPLVIEREKSSVKLVPTFILRQNLHIIDIAVSFHRIKLTNVESCEASNVFKHVQTSVQAFDVLRQNSYICNNTIITFIEWNSYMDDWKSKRDRWTNAIKQLLQLDILRQIRRTIDSLHQHRFHRHRTKLMEAEEGRIGGNDGGERSRQLSNVRTSS